MRLEIAVRAPLQFFKTNFCLKGPIAIHMLATKNIGFQKNCGFLVNHRFKLAS